MANTDANFVGSIPQNYDRYLGPFLFEPFALDLVKRLQVPPVPPAARVLEIACGTGIATRQLRAHLPSDTTLIATDLNEPMLDYAKQSLGLGTHVDWRPADAQALPFPDAHFDAVVCQFGLMFVPDKGLAIREARRVLRTGGCFAFNVWANLAENPVGHTADQVISSFFPADPPSFYRVPFGLDDQPLLIDLLSNAGFEVQQSERVTLEGRSPCAHDAARGLVLGNPVLFAIQDRGSADPEDIIAALGRALVSAGGEQPLRLPIRAVVFIARAV